MAAPRRTLRALLAVCALAAVLGPASAQAGYTTQLGGGTLALSGDDASDALLVTRDGDAIVYTVNGGPVQPTGATLTSVSRLDVTAGGGDDDVRFVGNITLGADVSGGAGDDTLFGTPVQDRINGGDGNDAITPVRDNDLAVGDAGDDVVTWNPGDGSDTIDGGDGNDSHVFNGSNTGEVMTLNAIAGSQDLSLTRNVATINQTLRRTERIKVTMLGAVDTFTAGDDLAPGGLRTLEVDLGETTAGGPQQSFDGSDISDVGSGGAESDLFRGVGGDDTWKWKPGNGQDIVFGGAGTDHLAVEGTDNSDVFSATRKNEGSFELSGGTPADQIGPESVDRIDLDLRAGDDRFVPLGDLGSLAAVDANGGPGADVLEGTSGADSLRGGEGDDLLAGRGGDDGLSGDGGTDDLSGGSGRDSFACGGLGDSFDATPEDTVAADCVKPADPQPQGPGGPQDPGGQQQDDSLPPGFLGFGRPAVRATGGGLAVTLKSTAAKPVRIKLAASEKPGGRGKAQRYRAVTKTIAPGAKVKVALKAPAAVRKQIGRALQRSGKVIRKPTLTLTNVDTGGKRTVKPRVTLKQH